MLCSNILSLVVNLIKLAASKLMFTACLPAAPSPFTRIGEERKIQQPQEEGPQRSDAEPATCVHIHHCYCDTGAATSGSTVVICSVVHCSVLHCSSLHVVRRLVVLIHAGFNVAALALAKKQLGTVTVILVVDQDNQ